MARAVFCAKALGLSKVLCSMDTIKSYGAEAAEVVVLVGKGNPAHVFSGRLNGGFQGLFLLEGIGGNSRCFGKRRGMRGRTKVSAF